MTWKHVVVVVAWLGTTVGLILTRHTTAAVWVTFGLLVAAGSIGSS